jgi:ATPase subunit of ABC transporter with duplicated ATPase domains
MSDDKKVIFSMQKLSKTYSSSDKQVLKNIYLSFFYGAKIGILGLNGSGKSSLLKIIAGVDKNYQGDVVFQPGYTVGYLEQAKLLIQYPNQIRPQVVQTRIFHKEHWSHSQQLKGLLQLHTEMPALRLQIMDPEQQDSFVVHRLTVDRSMALFALPH